LEKNYTDSEKNIILEGIDKVQGAYFLENLYSSKDVNSVPNICSVSMSAFLYAKGNHRYHPASHRYHPAS